MISDEKLRKREHLLAVRDFARAYKKGRSSREGFLVMYSVANTLAYNRIGFSIGSKKVRRATARNTLRRQLREAFRKNKQSVKKGYDLVLVVLRDPAKRPAYKMMERSYLSLINKNGLQC